MADESTDDPKNPTPSGEEKGKAPGAPGPQTGRFGRMFAIGKLGAKAGGRIAATKTANLFRDEGARDKKSLESFEKAARDLVKTSGRMKGAFMKLGQLLSSQYDILPEQVVDVMSELQSNAPPMDYALVAGQIAAEFGKAPEDVFASFEREPMSAASLGQVHRATLHDGTPVAVKIQYPGIDKAVRADLDNVEGLLKMLRLIRRDFDWEGPVGEIREHLLKELDYREELKSLQEFGAIYAGHPNFRVPEAFPEYCGERVLTMAYFEGYALKDLMNEGADPELKEWAAAALLDYVWRSLMEHAIIHADPHPGNFLVLPGPKLGILDFGCVRRYDRDYALNFRKLMRAAVEKDDDGMARILQRLRFYEDPAHTPAFLEMMYSFAAPYMARRPIRADEYDRKAIFERLPKLLLEYKIVNQPKELVLQWRVILGVWGFILALGVPIDAHAVIEPYLWPEGEPIL